MKSVHWPFFCGICGGILFIYGMDLVDFGFLLRTYFLLFAYFVQCVMCGFFFRTPPSLGALEKTRYILKKNDVKCGDTR